MKYFIDNLHTGTVLLTLHGLPTEFTGDGILTEVNQIYLGLIYEDGIVHSAAFLYQLTETIMAT